MNKDGFYVDDGTPGWLATGGGDREGEPRVANIVAAVSEHATYPGWLQYCYEQGVPSGYCTELWRSCRIGVETLEGSDESAGEISDPRLLGLSLDVECRRALVLVGLSGCGKTTWARRYAPRPCLFVRHTDDL
ncbi:hypothetical protein DFS34DRAFT_598500 [Phlyctochytrium arcticum]|nr:hypothetical protein DFS34DRAFT_598500 [Phlyctochytrium arcticum]